MMFFLLVYRLGEDSEKGKSLVGGFVYLSTFEHSKHVRFSGGIAEIKESNTFRISIPGFKTLSVKKKEAYRIDFTLFGDGQNIDRAFE